MGEIRIRQAETAAEIAEVQALMREYLDWWMAREKDAPEAPTFADAYREIDGFPGIYVPPKGRLLLAYDGDQAAGCIMLKPVDATICELKRLYVRPAHRGKGIGQALVAHLMQEARAIGYRKVILDSHITMESAHGIYEAHGFRRIDPPADYPASLKPIVVFMEAEL